MQTTKHPYELLIRWDQTGALAGAHVQHRYVIRDDAGKVIGETLGSAEPLTLESAAGFPLGDLLAQTHIDALARTSALDAERDALAARVAELEAQISGTPIA
ncbi:hypothetical protein [Azospirillum brasilense]|uniref:hypothetical protein n=1 Tax=Azospirillum brasilense TaxID=192 RepID=UPI000E676B2D|nr:hypothetical protein [Azospirillum brasilense]NUB25639.1 hypothetical protein [Azospirillum brasilense]NUB33720.1 hypothetical protein [Azospirillum brasilense]RIV99648.1 hypothetical protein D2T81_22975 [Azospirillum brasilense]